jgi:hypothetical protein
VRGLACGSDIFLFGGWVIPRFESIHRLWVIVVGVRVLAYVGGDTALPMRDVIRLASDSIHYLAVFDDHTERPLYLGRQTRIATADQRIICYAYNVGFARRRESGYASREARQGVSV